MIIDAMSKWKTAVPKFCRMPKGLSTTEQPLSFQLTASKVHGFATLAMWQYGGQLQGSGSGANAMCDIILHNLWCCYDAKGYLPRTLQLQMDNCAKDNKNHTVFGFLAALVQREVVESVEVSSVINLS